jgi:hypothetical protein
LHLSEDATAQEISDARALIEAHDARQRTPVELRRAAAGKRRAELRETLAALDADSNLTTANVALVVRYLLMRLIEEGDL